ncbi:MAG: hypothetical protein GXD23_10405 [Comamonadaceae bacterium]|jgi:hypothetical protein|nr:hypothetical protein [Comamonadaceae bacterium]
MSFIFASLLPSNPFKSNKFKEGVCQKDGTFHLGMLADYMEHAGGKALYLNKAPSLTGKGVAFVSTHRKTSSHTLFAENGDKAAAARQLEKTIGGMFANGQYYGPKVQAAKELLLSRLTQYHEVSKEPEVLKALRDLAEARNDQKRALTFIDQNVQDADVKNKLASALRFGFSRLTEANIFDENRKLMDQLASILRKCQDGSPADLKMFAELTQGFEGCQATQQRYIHTVYFNLENGIYEGKDLNALIGIPFSRLNEAALEQALDELHPDYKGIDDELQQHPHVQMEHRKLGAIAVAGQSMGFDAAMQQIGRADKHRYKYSAEELENLREIFAQKLKKGQIDFLIEMANWLNGPGVERSQRPIMAKDSEFNRWVNEAGHPNRAIEFMCIHDEEEIAAAVKKYPGLAQPGAGFDDVADLFFTPDDVLRLLVAMGSLDQADALSLQHAMDGIAVAQKPVAPKLEPLAGPSAQPVAVKHDEPSPVNPFEAALIEVFGRLKDDMDKNHETQRQLHDAEGRLIAELTVVTKEGLGYQQVCLREVAPSQAYSSGAYSVIMSVTGKSLFWPGMKKQAQNATDVEKKMTQWLALAQQFQSDAAVPPSAQGPVVEAPASALQKSQPGLMGALATLYEQMINAGRGELWLDKTGQVRYDQRIPSQIAATVAISATSDGTPVLTLQNPEAYRSEGKTGLWGSATIPVDGSVGSFRLNRTGDLNQFDPQVVQTRIEGLLNFTRQFQAGV